MLTVLIKLLVLIIALYWGKDFQWNTQKPQIHVLRFELAQTSHFWLCGTIPTQVPTRYSHIACKIWECIYMQKD